MTVKAVTTSLAPIEISEQSEKISYSNLNVGDILLTDNGGQVKIMEITPYTYPNGETSRISSWFVLYGECAGPHSCKHSYRNNVNHLCVASRLISPEASRL
jgi:hypothetical protein